MNVDHGMRVQTIINQEQAKKDLQSISSEMSAGPVLILRHGFKLRPRNVFQMFRPYPLSSGPVAVKVDQAARLDDLALILGHILNVEVDLLRSAVLDDVSLDVGEVSVERRTDAGDIDIISDIEDSGLAFEMEGDHAPVHDIGAVSLGSVLLCDIGKSADDTLAGSRLFAGRAVAGFVGIDHGTDLDVLYIDGLGARNCADHIIDVRQDRILVRGVFACNAVTLDLIDSLGAADIFGITP